MAGKAAVFSSFSDFPDLPARDGAYDRKIGNVRMEKDIAESQKHRAPRSDKILQKMRIRLSGGKIAGR
jgi:hypothetical protein